MLGTTCRSAGTHDLGQIGAACVQIDATLAEMVDQASLLTEYAWKFRYPGDQEEPTREETEAALDLARDVCAAIQARLPPETRP